MLKKVSLALRILAAAILLQTLFFKFSGAEESIYIFTTLGVEPFGRWFAGFSELIACILLLWPATKSLGALAAIGIMFGAILSHLFVLGVVVKNDGGLLFSLAWVVLLSSTAIVVIEKDQIFSYIQRAKTLLKMERTT